MAATKIEEKYKVNWSKLVSDIKDKGLSDYKISQCCGIQQVQLDRIKSGSEPKYRVGVLLIGLHEVMTGQKSPYLHN